MRFYGALKLVAGMSLATATGTGVCFGNEVDVRKLCRECCCLAEELAAVREDDIVAVIDILAHNTVNVRDSNGF